MRKGCRAKDLDSSCKGLPYSAKFHGKWLHCIQITKPCHTGTTILITNSGPFARSAKIRLRAYDRDDNIVAESSVTVRFYKFNWQYRRLQSQEIVSDNMFSPTVEPTATESETLVSFVTAFFTKVFWWFVR